MSQGYHEGRKKSVYLRIKSHLNATWLLEVSCLLYRGLVAIGGVHVST